jgi:hypothetical protein
MASSFTTNKSIEKPGYGDYAANATGWSGPINTDWDIIDAAFGGLTSLTDVAGTFTLLTAQYRNLILQSSAVLTNNVRYDVPSGVGGQWIVRNATSGNSTFTIGTTAGGGTSVIIPQGSITTIYSDGTNIRAVGSTADRFPAGGIMMWSGTIATIPTGWFLCNGSNGTPDLRNRFIIGAAQDDAGVAKTNITGTLTQTGGNKDAVVVTHTHTATVTDPGHTHLLVGSGAREDLSAANRIKVVTSSSEGGLPNENFEYYLNGTSAAATLGLSGSSQTSITVANSNQGVSGDNANLPPYYALAYIMRGPY